MRGKVVKVHFHLICRILKNIILGSFWFVAAKSAMASQLVYCSEAYPPTLAPQMGTSMTTMNVGQHVFDSLLVQDPRTGEFSPSVAKTWSISKDGLTYTFTLREDVAFHESEIFKPSRNLNADDIVYTFQRMLDPKHPFHKVSGGNYSSFFGYGVNLSLKEVKKISPTTVQFILKTPIAPLLTYLSFAGLGSLQSAEYADLAVKLKNLELVDKQPIGTGPFQLVKQQNEVNLRFKAFAKYFKGKAKFDDLIFSTVTEAAVRQQKLLAGECDVIFSPQFSDLPKFAANPKFKVHDSPGTNIFYLQMNAQKAPFDNPKVREAVAHSLNRENYVKAIYQGKAKVLNSLVPESFWSYIDGKSEFTYEPERARVLLKEAGFPNGFETTLWALPVSRPYNPDGKKMAELMQADLAKVGIKAKIVSYDWGTYLDKASKGEYDLYQIGTSEVLDPDAYYSYFTCQAVEMSDNTWCNKDFDKYLQLAKQVTDRKKRMAFYEKAFEVFKKDKPVVPIATGNIVQISSARVKSYAPGPDGSVDFYGSSVE